MRIRQIIRHLRKDTEHLIAIGQLQKVTLNDIDFIIVYGHTVKVRGDIDSTVRRLHIHVNHMLTETCKLPNTYYYYNSRLKHGSTTPHLARCNGLTDILTGLESIPWEVTHAL